MSRIGKLPISLPTGVEVVVGSDNSVTVKGPKGTLTTPVDRDIIRPSRERIQDEDLPDYAARVATMRSPIKRD